jgi:hypothetical protein
MGPPQEDRARRTFRLILGCVALSSTVACGGESSSPTTPTTPTPSPPLVSSYFTDFESGLPPEWSGGGAVEGTQGYPSAVPSFRSLFLRNDTRVDSPVVSQTHTVLRLRLSAHESLRLSFLLAIIDSWDGSTGAPYGPDFFNVTLDGATVYRAAFSCYDRGSNPSTELVFGRSLGFHPVAQDAAFSISFEKPHTATEASIEFFADGAGWQGALDESWAVDDVKVVAKSR